MTGARKSGVASHAGDQASATVLVEVPRDVAFRVFTTEIDQWWRRGPRFRSSGKHAGVIHLEPRLGGRVFESFDTSSGPKVIETGIITSFLPPEAISFKWRGANFEKDEWTEVEITFREQSRGTLVRVVHRGFAALPSDHPVRHGQPDREFLRMIGLFWADLIAALNHHVNR